MLATLVLVEIDCDWPPPRLEESVATLPLEVQRRAARYLHEGARRNLIVTQVCLHSVLRRLDLSPTLLEACPNGRPRLSEPLLEFNLSHSGSRGVLALSRSPRLRGCLGVDLECIDRPLDAGALARRFFTPTEYRYALGDASRFFFVWTRKEAVLKSNGIGLRVALDSFDVLSDSVEEEVTGRRLGLRTVPRSPNLMVSWAVPRESAGGPVRWVEAFTPGWLDRVTEGIDA